MVVEFNPKKFNPKFSSVGCFIECDGEIVVVFRHKNKPFGETYGLPSGKIDPGETPHQAMVREIREETGLMFDKVELLKEYAVRYDEYDFKYYLYKKVLSQKNDLVLSPKEHNDVLWMEPKEVYYKPMIPGFKEILEEFYNV